MAVAFEDEHEDMFNCAICLEIYIKPMKIQCGHVFCTACIADDLKLVSPQCSLCRKTYSPANTARDKQLEKRMDKTKRNCSGCSQKILKIMRNVPTKKFPRYTWGKKIQYKVRHSLYAAIGMCMQKTEFSVSKLNSHMASCPKIADHQAISKFKPVAETKQKQNITNRSTFMCPFCGASNLDCEGLRKHCNNNHKHESAPVTCPICSSMPWGDPNYRSSDFIGHLNMRHQFEYGTYVDFHTSEDEVLHQVLQNSMVQK